MIITLIKNFTTKLIMLFFNNFFNLLIRLYYFYRGFNDENFVEVKQVTKHNKSTPPYLLELKDSHFFDEVLVTLTHGQEPIHAQWYDIDSIKCIPY